MFNSVDVDPSGRIPQMTENDDVARKCWWMTDGRPCGMLCQNAFELKTHLKIHIRGIRDYVCKWKDCPLRMTGLQKSVRYDRHVIRHAGARPFSCNICGKEFADSGSVARHRRIHERTNDIECTMCARKFSTVAAHSHHMKDHSLNKPFACEDCGIRFSGANARLAHIRKYHGKMTSTPIQQFSLLDLTEESVNAEPPTFSQTTEVLDFSAIWDLYIADITGNGNVVETPLEVVTEIDPYDLFVPHIDVYFKLVRL